MRWPRKTGENLFVGGLLVGCGALMYGHAFCGWQTPPVVGWFLIGTIFGASAVAWLLDKTEGATEGRRLASGSELRRGPGRDRLHRVAIGIVGLLTIFAFGFLIGNEFGFPRRPNWTAIGALATTAAVLVALLPIYRSWRFSAHEVLSLRTEVADITERLWWDRSLLGRAVMASNKGKIEASVPSELPSAVFSALGPRILYKFAHAERMCLNDLHSQMNLQQEMIKEMSRIRSHLFLDDNDVSAWRQFDEAVQGAYLATWQMVWFANAFGDGNYPTSASETAQQALRKLLEGAEGLTYEQIRALSEEEIFDLDGGGRRPI